MSHNYPEPYDSRRTCVWNITCMNGHRVKLVSKMEGLTSINNFDRSRRVGKRQLINLYEFLSYLIRS